MPIRYFKEYYLLKSKYQDITQVIAGVGLVGGIFLFWNVIGPMLGAAIRPSDPTEEYSSVLLLLVLLGLPISIWLCLLAMSLIQALRKKISYEEAIAFSCRFSYPDQWLKERSDVAIRQDKIEELDERLKGNDPD